MLDIITKKELFQWLDTKIILPEQMTRGLKSIQDCFILSKIRNIKNKKIAEIGGGHSRVLNSLSKKNELWNIDKFEGKGNGPKKIRKQGKVKTIREYLGDFSEKIPENYFDIVFSISVIEHISTEKIKPFFEDLHRILKKGGESYHAIDLYLHEDEKNNEYSIKRIKIIKEAIKNKFEFIEEAKIKNKIKFKTEYASNDDKTVYSWFKNVPEKRKLEYQSVSLKLGLRKI